MAGEVLVKESVPAFRKRLGDVVLNGSQNATIVLGGDRATDEGSGYGNSVGAGSVQIVAGRAGPGFSHKDVSSVHVSMKTDPDSLPEISVPGTSFKGEPGIVVRTDHVRIVARQSLKVLVGKSYLTMFSDGSIVVDGDLKLGEGAVQSLLHAEDFAKHMDGHVHSTATGLSSAPVEPTPSSVFTKKVRAE